YASLPDRPLIILGRICWGAGFVERNVSLLSRLQRPGTPRTITCDQRVSESSVVHEGHSHSGLDTGAKRIERILVQCPPSSALDTARCDQRGGFNLVREVNRSCGASIRECRRRRLLRDGTTNLQSP